MDAENYQAHPKDRAPVLGWFGTIMAMSGSAMVASNTAITPYGWIAFVVGSIALFLWARKNRSPHQTLMNVYFFFVNCFGVYRYFQ